MKALIVDDELFCRENLKFIIDEYCPEISSIAQAGSAEEARAYLSESDADILFLDIKMPNENGFDLLESINNKNLSVIFTTAHNEFALKAIKAQAIDYLEKPINIDDVQAAVKKAELKSKKHDNSLD